MSTGKTVIGFNDNLDSRVQDLAPTQYALGKLRAARTPYDVNGTTVLNDPNRILRPGLYLMELSTANVNTANIKSGVLYIYQLSADPDNSLHGGHVVEDITTAMMSIRQIGYFHNNGVEKVMTRVGTPDTSQFHAANKVQLLKNIGDRTTGITFVVELGMWVRHYINSSNEFVIEPAVTWSDWHEINGDGGNVKFNIDTTFSNGVGMYAITSTAFAAKANLAEASSAGTVYIESTVFDPSNEHSPVVPTTAAVRYALGIVSQGVITASQTAVGASGVAVAAAREASDVSTALYNHINSGHPSAVSPATYTNTASATGVVYTTPTVASMTETLTKYKYTVPTVNAVANVVTTLNDAIVAVSSVLSDHIAHDSAGLIEEVGYPFFIDHSADVAILSMAYDFTSAYGGIGFTSTHDENGMPRFAVVGQPASLSTFGVVKATSDIVSYSHTYMRDSMISGYVDEYTIPTMNALYNASSSISSRMTAMAATFGDNISVVSSATNLKIDGVSAELVTYAGSISKTLTNNIYDVSRDLTFYATETSRGISSYINSINDIFIESVGAVSGDLVSVSSALQSEIDAIDPGGGGGTYDGIMIQAVGEPLYMAIDEVSTLRISSAMIDEGPGVVKITNSVPIPDDSSTVPTAHAVYSSLLTAGKGSAAFFPDYSNPFGWTPEDATGSVVFSGTAGPLGGYVMMSITLGSAFGGCVGAQVGDNFVHLIGGGGPLKTTKLLPIPAGKIVKVYDGGAVVSACGYGVS